MIAPTTHNLGIALAVAAFALMAAGCYYVPDHRDYYAYDYYGHRHYVPYTDLSIIYYGGGGHHHDGYRNHHWRGVPYRHHGERHDYRREHGNRHYGDRRHHRDRDGRRR